MPPLKELHYFDQLSRVQRSSSSRRRDERDLRFLESINSLSAKPYIDFEHYARLFEPKGPLLSGDISPNYSTLSNKVIRQIVGYFPKLKVIFLARDPVERRVVALVHGSALPPDRSVRRNRYRRSQSEFAPARDALAFVSQRSRRAMETLCSSRPVSLYFFDDLQRNPTELRRSVLDFLGADPDKPASRVPADTTVGPGWKSFRLRIKFGRIWHSSFRKS
jgi:hypothetical protein